MRPFTRLAGIAAAMPVANVDTDTILPAEFLKTVSREGLRRGLFHRLRYDANGVERIDFVLNEAPWRRASILIAGDNFGCGSSREHAPWALLDFGIRCIVAPSFAEIFHQNCLKNGMLLIQPPSSDVKTLLEDARSPEQAQLIVDLEACAITRADGAIMPFGIDAASRIRLLDGADDVALSLRKLPEIEIHERGIYHRRPWVTGITLP
jgi:3-isopropylmalate/(R)-2-methylmalate dehydratase small subunit